MKSENTGIKSSCNFVHFVDKKLFGLILLILFLLTTYTHAQDFTARSLGDYNNVTVMEVTGNYDAKNSDGATNDLPRQEIAKEFFKTHKDEYDFLVIFSNFNFQMPESEAKAFYTPVRNDVRGIGIDLFDNSSFYGSSGKLQGTVDMGNVSNHVTDPLDPKFEETLYFLSHEMMHRWGANVKFRDASGNISSNLLGRDGDHWSFLLDTSGSALYGNRWQDNGNGTFTSLAPHKEMKLYSPLDLYLMGMMDKSQVPPMLLIENPAIDRGRLPEVGVTISGTPRHVTIDDIIAAEGERVPGAEISQKKFKSAFIFVTAPGTFTGKEIQEIENVRNGGITRFSILTDGKSIMEVASTLREDVPVNPGVILPSTTPRTLPPNIEDGVNWLVNSQTNDGSWLDLSSTMDRDTAEATRVLKNFDIAHASYLKGVNWLSGVNSENNADYLARKIEALTGSGNDVTGLIGEIISMQNADGGWGSERSYSSSPMDTSIVLKSLYSAGYSDQGVIFRAINYLKSKQNSDGGWGSEDRGSMVQPTSNVLSAFNNLRKTYTLDDRIASGTAWLIGKQNTDGGFGNSPSTVYDTATALLTLAELSASKDTTNKALNYILNNQAGDGSWNESPYQTALAIAAVLKAQIDPDLSITSDQITFIPPQITRLPTNVVINADIANLGRTGAQAKVALFEGDPSLGNKIGEQTLVFPGQSTTTVTFYVEVKDGNEHIYYIVLDQEDIIKESNEANNKAVKILEPQLTYDLEISNESVTLSSALIDKYQDIKVTSQIKNTGTVDAYNVHLRYSIDKNGMVHEIATITLDVVPANGTATNEITWMADMAGENMRLIVEVDPFSVFSELSEQNNRSESMITVNDVIVTDPNLSISYTDIVITPNPANERGSANISAVVRNRGFSTAYNVAVGFYNGVPGQGGQLLGTQTIESLGIGQIVTVSFDWTDIPVSGNKIIYVKVDPGNLITEVREDDNDAFKTLQILTLPDLLAGEGSIVMTPSEPKEGDTASIVITLQNKGQQDATNVMVKLMDGTSEIGSQVVPMVEGNSQTTASFTLGPLTTGMHQLTVSADPDNAIHEQKEDNNTAIRVFGVQSSKIWVTERYISPNGDGVKDATSIAFMLEKQGNVSMEIIDVEGKKVRTISGQGLENTWGTEVPWNGLTDSGTVAEDGDYKVRIVSSDGASLADTNVVVDNNRSPFKRAIGTKYFSKNIYPVVSPSNYGYMRFEGPTADESGFIMSWRYDISGWWKCENQNYTDGQGIYKFSPDSGYLEKINPFEWHERSYCDLRFSIAMPSGANKIAVALQNISTFDGWNSYLGELWVYDGDANRWNMVDQSHLPDSDKADINYPTWSSGGNIAYESLASVENNTKEYSLFAISADGTSRTQIEETIDQYWLHQYKWSPSGSKLAYQKNINEIWLSNLSGDKRMLYAANELQEFNWIDDGRILFKEKYDDNDRDYYKLSILDVADGAATLLANEAIGYNISPDMLHIAVMTRRDNKVAFKVFDINQNEPIFESEQDWSNNSIPFFETNISFNKWSDDGRKLYISQHQYNQATERGIWIYDLYANVLTWHILENVEYYANAALWDRDNSTLIIAVRNYGDVGSSMRLLPMDTDTGVIKETFGSVRSPYRCEYGEVGGCINYGWTPSKNAIYRFYNESGSGYKIDLVRSLLNLPAVLQISRQRSMLVLKGTAADLNFEGFELEYADVKTSDEWTLIAPPSTTEVINNVFATWVPPAEGSYLVRLTVWDKAGNKVKKVKRVSWGQAHGITNVVKNREYISPNGDGENETVEVRYKVLEPLHLEFNIYDEQNHLIKTFSRDHAIIGEFSLSWDGTDSIGSVVSDGKYKISVSGYDIFVVVDNTPPNAEIEVGKIGKLSYPYYSYAVDLSGLAYDSNIKSWTIESGIGENPQEWALIRSGEGNFAKIYSDGTIANPLAKATFQIYENDQIATLAGKKVRLTVEDLAGNKVSRLAEFMDEKILFLTWDGKSNNYSIPSVWLKPGSHTSSLFETFEAPFETLVFQYRVGLDWHDSDADIQSSDGSIKIAWNIPVVNGEITALRLKGIDITGSERYSNILHTESALKMTPPPCGSNTLKIENYIAEELEELRIVVGDKTYLYNRASANIPYGEFKISLSMEGIYLVYLTATGISGKEYFGGSFKYPPACLNAELNIVYPKGGDCGSMPNSALIELKMELMDATILSAGYYIGDDLLHDYDIAHGEMPGNFKIDMSKMNEGTYAVSARIGYKNKNGEFHEANLSDLLIVDRTLPVSQITSPEPTTMVCPVKYGKTYSEWYGVNLEGSATDGSGLQEYQLYYAPVDYPDSWQQAQTVKYDKKIPLTGQINTIGGLGAWDVTTLRGTDYVVKLKTIDKVGNVSCYEAPVSIDALTEIRAVNTSATLFSPNGDGYLDDVEFGYTIDESAEVDVFATTLSYDSGYMPVFGETPVRTLAKGSIHVDGEASYSWDGLNDSGQSVADGKYALHVRATDSCKNVSRSWSPVEIDKTLPVVQISYPVSNDQFNQNTIEVKGTASDDKLMQYLLEVGQGDYPDSWMPISSKNLSITNDVLGRWNTVDVTGIWTLRLTATDRAGNRNETRATFNIPEKRALIGSLDMSRDIFSPNNDGKADSVDLTYALTEQCNVSLKVFNSTGAVVKNVVLGTMGVGTYNYVWDGRLDGGVAVPDGLYTISLRAVLTSNPDTVNEEKVTVTIDNTVPLIIISNLQNDIFLSTKVEIKGDIKDLHMAEYTVSYSGGAINETVEQGSQSVESHLFGILEDMPEGAYTLLATAKDLAENQASQSIRFNIDYTVPVVTLESPTDGEYFGNNKTAVDISGGVVEDNLKLYELRYGIGDPPGSILKSGDSRPADGYTGRLNVETGSGVIDGIYTISLAATDKAGSTGKSSVKIRIDNTPPVVSITSLTDGALIKGPVDVKGSVKDANLANYDVEASEGQCAEAYKWTLLKSSGTQVDNGVIFSWRSFQQDGDYCLKVTATDKVGYISDVKINVTVDTEPPAAPELSGSIYKGTIATLEWSGNYETDFAGYNLYRNNVRVNSQLIKVNSYTDEKLTPGYYSYVAKAVDAAGAESLPSNSVTLRAYQSKPVASITYPRSGSKVSGLVEIKGLANSNEDFMEYRVYIGEGANPQSWNLIRTSPIPMTYDVLSDWNTVALPGTDYSIKVESEDLSNNVATSIVTVSVDNTPPASPNITTVTASASDATVVWQSNTETDLAGYIVFRNDDVANAGGMIVDSYTPFLLGKTVTQYIDKALPDGRHYYYMFAVDEAGNISAESARMEINIDTHPPTAVITEPLAGTVFEKDVRLTAECGDTDVASVQFEYMRKDSSQWLALGNPATLLPYTAFIGPSVLGANYGEYEIRAVAIDNAGHIDPAPMSVIVRYGDLTPPSPPVNVVSRADGNSVNITWNGNTEPDLAGYDVYSVMQDGTKNKISSSIVTAANYTIANLSEGRYTFEVTAVDTSNNESGYSNGSSANIYRPLIHAPSFAEQENIEVTGVNAAPGGSVEIFVGGNSAGFATASADGTFSMTVVIPEGQSVITAVCTDSEGSRSMASNAAYVEYNMPPSAPTGLTGTVHDYNNVDLSWNANTETDIDGYNLYRDGLKINTSGLIKGGASSTGRIREGMVTASPNSNPEFAALAFDGDEHTYWKAQFTPDERTWWQVEFGSAVTVEKIDIKFANYDPYLMPPVWMEIIGSYQNIPVWHTHYDSDMLILNIPMFPIPPIKTDKVSIYIFTDFYRLDSIAISEFIFYGQGTSSATAYQDTGLADGVYTYNLTAVDRYGLESGPSESVTVHIGDTTPPAAPTGLSASASGSDVRLDWAQNTESDLAGYYVYKNTDSGWQKITPALITGTTYTDNNVPNGTYTYRITAVDAKGNESDASSEASAVVNVAPPQPPVLTGVAPAPEGRALNLTWETSYSVACNVYRGFASGGPYQRINSAPVTSSTYLDTELVDGNRYYYVITGIDASGNEGPYSNEASGMPMDTLPPVSPKIAVPTIPGVPLVLYGPIADVSGSAEGGVAVRLFRNGELVGEASTAKDETATTELADSTYSDFSVSPDGKKLFYITGSQMIWLKYYLTGSETMIDQSVTGAEWAPDGRKIAFVKNDGVAGRIWIYDVEGGTKTYLNDNSTENEDNPAWAPDGKTIAMTIGGDIWLKDLEGGALTRTTAGENVKDLKFSPDGRNLSYFNVADGHVYIRDIINGSVTEGEKQVDGASAVWSPDSSKLLLLAYAENSWHVNIFDISSPAWTEVPASGSDPNHLSWSPDGQKILYSSRLYSSSTDYKTSIWSKDIGRDGEEKELVKNLDDLRYVEWLRKTGELAYLNGKSATKIYPEEHFEFRNVELYEGENILQAIAIDAAGNESVASQPVEVFYDNSNLPDLSVGQNDIYLSPKYPVSGEDVALNIDIWNNGKVSADNVKVNIFIWEIGGNIQLISSETLSSIAPGMSERISAKWNSTGKIGVNSVIVDIDPDNVIYEISEENNLATGEIIVSKDAGMSMVTEIDGKTYTSYQGMNIGIDLINNGLVKNISIDTLIEDEGGYEVYKFNTITTQLKYGNTKYALNWNTGVTYPGNYRVRTVIFDGNGAYVSESMASFMILPDINLEVEMFTDKAAYVANENVAIVTKMKNGGFNYAVPKVTVKMGVKNSSGGILYEQTKDIYYVLPGSTSTENLSWNTGFNVPGEYEAYVTAYIGENIISESHNTFSIKAISVISGKINVSSSVLIGNEIRADYSAKNSGNQSSSGSIVISILDPSSRTIMATKEKAVEMPLNTEISGSEVFDSSGMTLSKYDVILYYASTFGSKKIAEAAFNVIDGTPPTLSLLSPEKGNTYHSSIEISVVATDDASGVDKVECKIDAGQWTSIPTADPTAGRYIMNWEPTFADNGNHVINIRATDRSGNVSASISTDFIIQMDNVPPATIISVGAPKYEANEKVFISSTTRLTLAATDNFSGVSKTEYRIDNDDWILYSPFSIASEGSHLIEYRSIDNVGNMETTKSMSVTVDNTTPLTTIDFNQQNYIDGQNILVSRDTQVVLAATDNLSGVKGTYYSLDDEDGWRTYTGAFRLTDLTFGAHTIRYRSSDNVENTETEKSITLALIGMEVNTEILNLPRILVWTRDPSEIAGNKKPTYTLEDIKGFISGALNDKDIYFKMTTDKDEFQKEFRSGVYNMAAIIDQDTPFDAAFLREMREAVNRGMGLLVSGWENTTPPILEDVLGIEFKGSLSSSDAERTIYLYQSPVSPEESLTAKGKILKTSLTTGTLAGIVKGEEASIRADANKTIEDLPAVVFNTYGKGRAVFLSYDIVESALNRNMAEYAWMLKNSMNYLLPQEVKPEAAGISLLETKVKLHGAPMDLKAVDTLGEGLTYLPLFSLTHTPLEYTFHLSDGEETAYRYFVSVKDKIGSYGKDTDIYLGIGSGYTLFDKYQYIFAIDTDSDLLLQQAVAWVNEQIAAHPESTDSLNTIYNELVTIAFMPKLTAADVDKVIHQVVQTIHQINQLPFDTTRGREILDGYLRGMEGRNIPSTLN